MAKLKNWAAEQRKAGKRRLRVGDLVCIVFGTHELFGEVVEDRGRTGAEGRQVVTLAPRPYDGGRFERWSVSAFEVSLEWPAVRRDRTAAKRRAQRRLRVGDQVRFPFGSHEVRAEVVADRGNIGVGGLQMVGILARTYAGGELERWDVAAQDVTLIKPRKRRRGTA